MNELQVAPATSLSPVEASAPAEVIQRAQAIAEPLADIIERQKLFVRMS